jgi:putative SOS response-associated peptidase YedK
MPLAGLRETYCDPDGGEIDTAAIITTDANGTLAAIHERMPVILPTDRIAAWLDCAAYDDEAAMALVRPCPDEWLRMVPVSPRVNAVGNDDPQLQEPVGGSAPSNAAGVKTAKPLPDEDAQGRLF